MAEISSALFTSFLPKFSQLPFLPNLHGFASAIGSANRRTRCSISAEQMPTGTSRPTIPWGCEIESLESGFALKQWLSDSGLPPQKMDIRRVDVGGRGLVALKSIRKGEKLLFVPPSLVITADSEWTRAEAGRVMRSNSVPDWPLLATYLISEASLGDSSRWCTYISALPRQPYSLLYWTRAELDMYLVASQIRVRAIERVSDVTGVYNDLQARIFSKHPTVFPEEVFNLETFKWSFGILFSRLVRLSAMDGKVALVPWADMLNHSSENMDTNVEHISASSSHSQPPNDIAPVANESVGEVIANESVDVERQAKRARSEIWQHFTQMSMSEKGKKVEKWKCNYCPKSYLKQKSGTTTQMCRHFRSNHYSRKEVQEKKQKFFDPMIESLEEVEMSPLCVSSNYNQICIFFVALLVARADFLFFLVAKSIVLLCLVARADRLFSRFHFCCLELELVAAVLKIGSYW